MQKKVYVHSFSRYDLEGKVDEVIEALVKLKADNPEAESDINIEICIEDNYGCPSIDVEVYYMREETEAEKREREEREAGFQAIRDQREKIEYERLKQKFGE